MNATTQDAKAMPTNCHPVQTTGSPSSKNLCFVVSQTFAAVIARKKAFTTRSTSTARSVKMLRNIAAVGICAVDVIGTELFIIF